MRNTLALVLAAGLLFLGLASIAQAYQRTVLIENFTNWG